MAQHTTGHGIVSRLLKKLMQAPVPSLDQAANPFLPQTDASVVGIGVLLEQGGQVLHIQAGHLQMLSVNTA